MIRSLTMAIAALAIAVTGCAAANTTTTIPQGSDGFPVTIDAPNGPITIDKQPGKIVSLSPTATEILFAIGAGGQVTAVDDQSNYPEEAPRTDLTGLEPNIEAIAAMDADLVVMMFDPGNETVAALDAIGIPSIVHGAAVDLDDAYAQIRQLGKATGNAVEAATLIATMSGDIERIVSATDAGQATYYHELGPDLYSATSATFVGALYSMLGLVNIADPADADGFGYPQLSAEFIVAENPDLIFLADTKCCAQDPGTVGERPGWHTLDAVQRGFVIELDDDVASRWGPRVVEFIAAVAGAVGALVGA
jgi:iron complex transport system substrate-binding protein